MKANNFQDLTTFFLDSCYNYTNFSLVFSISARDDRFNGRIFTNLSADIYFKCTLICFSKKSAK